jgi:hypothetical protein
MGPDRAQADAELIGDFLVQVAFGQKRQNLLFPPGQFFHLRGGALDLLEVGDHFARDLHRHRSAAGMDLLDGLDELGGRHVFQQVPAGPAAQGVKNQIALLVGSQHQHLQPGQPRFEAGNTFDAAHAGQVDVHQHHIRDFLGDRLQRLLPIGMGPHAAQPRRAADQFGQTFARAAAVLHDGNFDAHFGVPAVFWAAAV